MAKTDDENNYLFDDKILIYIFSQDLFIQFRINDFLSFLSFCPDRKKFIKLMGFGKNDKSSFYDLFKNTDNYVWKEMSE